MSSWQTGWRWRAGGTEEMFVSAWIVGFSAEFILQNSILYFCIKLQAFLSKHEITVIYSFTVKSVFGIEGGNDSEQN